MIVAIYDEELAAGIVSQVLLDGVSTTSIEEAPLFQTLLETIEIASETEGIVQIPLPVISDPAIGGSGS